MARHESWERHAAQQRQSLVIWSARIHQCRQSAEVRNGASPGSGDCFCIGMADEQRCSVNDAVTMSRVLPLATPVEASGVVSALA